MSQNQQFNGQTLPDIFITGVMKGGTTILHDYICTHPEISAGVQKEIHYFSLHYDKGPDWYAQHFSSVPENIRTIDASPTYFDVTNTSLLPRLIRSYTKDPRVIVITRDPIERAISQFIHLKVTTNVEALQNVDIDDFFSQDLADAYRQSTSIGFYLNLVLGFSLYSRKYMTYRQEFDQRQLLALDNKLLRQNPCEEMSKVFDFLNVEYVNNDLFGVVKYSNGSGVSKVSAETYQRLYEFLYPDYKIFCEQAGFDFETVEHHGN